ncbi:MAG: hypothetical protein NTY02_20625 [Acidobacteria bacterium]|nr:hypothetical protein [Acidobacteriota bacterium]
MSRLKELSEDPMLQEFAQGAATDSIQPVAEFLAPGVDVPTSVGRFKRYGLKNRFRIPNTVRGVGGRANEIKFSAEDAMYSCVPNALDYPIDNLEQLEAKGLENMFREGAVAIAEIAGLAHEKKVIDIAMDAAGAGTGKVWNADGDPVKDIDAAVLSVIKSANYGSAMGIGILFGATAWSIFKNAAKVAGKFIAGGQAGPGGYAIPTEQGATGLFVGRPDIRTSYMVFDDAPEGLEKDMKFMLDGTVLIFTRKQNPTRSDPSFMKTFRLAGQWMKPGAYSRDDGRVEVAKFDWSEDVQVTNTEGIVRLNVTDTAPQPPQG